MSGLSIASLVLGIISIFPQPLIGIPCGILALIFGIIGLGKAKKGLNSGKGLALAGIITGAVGLVISVIVIIAVITLFSSAIKMAQDGAMQAHMSSSTMQVMINATSSIYR